ncbi:HD domain-containing phosphohydrolase [Granulicella tundricola]|uniref:HD domain-containing phosphohydrolase n=1 Tax=Granulicella tundricola TaxID=940615 RepID=UPI0018DCF13A|nr:HD domain-containing phosphohydrolase [Granulicella tundricola]
MTILSAVAATVLAARQPSHSWPQFGLLLVAVLLSSGLKVQLPKGDGSMSLNFPFILLAIMQLSPLQAIILAALSVVVLGRIKVKKFFTLVQTTFNVANSMCATAAASATYAFQIRHHGPPAPALAIAALVYFFCSTATVAMVIAWCKAERAIPFWRAEFPWYLPFYIVGAALAAIAQHVTANFGWATSLLLIPMVYTVYRSYQGQMNRIKEREQHYEQTEALHLRTIEGLAMAIEAKDQNTHDHLFRVRSYVNEIGVALQLSKLEMKALQTAAFLHDIGKLAVPEHILNKPGKLTPEEFEKVKIHPVVGAEILERVRFPYPVVPIVRSHHEWWNGTGYPDGLKGEDIPIGARILTVVDCFDALASDRPYRKSLPPDEAMAIVKKMAGIQFDPGVVAVLEQRYTLLKQQADTEHERNFIPLNTDIEVWRGEAPGAGFERSDDDLQTLSLSDNSDTAELDQTAAFASLNLIAAASQEAQTLYEMSQGLGGSLSLKETISVMASRMRRLIPFDCCALYLPAGETLVAQHIDGECAKSFAAEPIPMGEGISGWVAQSGKAILNGNATVEPTYRGKAGEPGELRSALSIPLYNLQRQLLGVLTLYAIEAESFSRDHLRILQAMESKLSLSLQNAIQFKRAEKDAETDFLTNLPNARRLFLQLESELERCRTVGQDLAVIVCDLNAFKEVNDRRGHLAGNMLLSSIADGFRRGCTNVDTVARMGGDEFVFLLPTMSAEGSEARLREIAETVTQVAHTLGFDTRVSASLGAAFYPADGESAEELLALADRRMYLDKQAHYKTLEGTTSEHRGKAFAA